MEIKHKKIRLAILGYGNLGRFICDKIFNGSAASEMFEIVMVWNRTPGRFDDAGIPRELIKTGDLQEILKEDHTEVDLFVEVSHPSVIEKYGVLLLKKGNLFISSPTVFADKDTEERIISASRLNSRKCFMPIGASWGLFDVMRINDMLSIKRLRVTMKKHPDSFKLEEPLTTRLEKYKSDLENTAECIIYEGPVRPLCRLAPNNVNTMAILALGASHLGLDGTEARMIADKNLDHHVITIELESVNGLKVTTERVNPAAKGSVTGKATYDSFMSSLMFLDKVKSDTVFIFC